MSNISFPMYTGMTISPLLSPSEDDIVAITLLTVDYTVLSIILIRFLVPTTVSEPASPPPKNLPVDIS